MSELVRYARQIVLPEVGVNGQHLLRDSTVLIVGLGGLGSVAAEYLAAAGVGRLLLADYDRVEMSNLQRQILYRQEDVGRAKAQTAARALQALNPLVELRPIGERLAAPRLRALVAEADAVLDCSDNFPTRFAVNEACVAQRRPLVAGAAIRLEGQLAVFDLRRGGPCYACLFPPGGPDAERCEEAGVLGPVVGVIGSLQALAALQLLLGLPAGAGTLTTWDAAGGQWRRLQVSADPACAVCAGKR